MSGFFGDERRKLVQRSRSRSIVFRDTLPEDQREDADLVQMKRYLQEGRKYGEWDDERFELPHPARQCAG